MAFTSTPSADLFASPPAWLDRLRRKKRESKEKRRQTSDEIPPSSRSSSTLASAASTISSLDISTPTSSSSSGSIRTFFDRFAKRRQEDSCTRTAGKHYQRSRTGKSSQSSPSSSPPISNRSSSLYFPPSELSYDREYACAYQAGFAASFADLRSTGTASNTWKRPQAGHRLPTSHSHPAYLGSAVDLSSLGSARYTYNQDNFTCLELPTFASNPKQRLGEYGASLVSLHTSHTPSPLSSPSRQSLLLTPPKNIRRKVVDYSPVMATSQVDLQYPAGLGNGSVERVDIWHNPYDSDPEHDTVAMNAPPVPPRSTLRSVASASNLLQRAAGQPASSSSSSSSSVLPGALVMRNMTVDPPLSAPLASSSSAGISSPPSTASPGGAQGEGFLSSRRQKVAAAHKRGASLGGDPMRVKDGIQAKGSSSGVYTPPTFRSHSTTTPSPTTISTAVYTPTSFTLYPTRPSAYPSGMAPPTPGRSTSVSSSTSASSAEAVTPLTPSAPSPPSASSRWFGTVSASVGSAVSGIKRASASVSSRASSISSPTYLYTPTSAREPAREGYFPSTSTMSHGSYRDSMVVGGWPSSADHEAGLGILAPPPAIGGEGRRWRAESNASAVSGHVVVGDVPKGKRKPVPKVSAGDDDQSRRSSGEELCAA